MIGGGAGIALVSPGVVYATGTSYAGMPTSQTPYMGSLPHNYLGFARLPRAVRSQPVAG